MDTLLQIMGYIATAYTLLSLAAFVVVPIICFFEPKPSKEEIERMIWKGKW